MADPATPLTTGPSRAADPFRTELMSLLPHLRAFARGLCGRPEQADDLAQETAMRALTARDKFTPGTSMKAWTFTILRNLYLNSLRRNRFIGDYDQDHAERTLVARPAQEDSLHMSDLQAALDRLSEDRREALLLIGASGFAYEEAAQICGVPVGTMKSRVARARAQLTAMLEEGAAS